MRRLQDTVGAIAPRTGDGQIVELELPEAVDGAPAESDRRRALILRRDSSFRRAVALADALAVSVALGLSTVLLGDDALALGTLAVPFLLVIGAKAAGLYERDEHLTHRTTLDEVPALFLLATTSTLVIWLANGLVIDGELGRRQIIGTWFLLAALLIAFRSLARLSVGTLVPTERCLFVGDEAGFLELRQALDTAHAARAELVGWVPTPSPSDDGGLADRAGRIRTLIAENDVHRVILGPEPARSVTLLDSIRLIKGHGVKVSVLPDIARVVSSPVELDRIGGVTLLGIRSFEIGRSSRAIKRSLDLVGSTLALLLSAPVMAMAALAIKVDSRGPVFFRQQRAGRHGEPFEMLKFRSMAEGAEESREDLRHLNESEGLFKIADDPRVTRVGRFLRRFHIDELPQLFNVLRGEMSLVGPRPLVLNEDRQIVGWRRRRLDLRPGITGPWQVLGAARIPLREMVRLDYAYVANWSVWNDVRILLLTVSVVLRRRGM
ncbi:MAG: sugar transferase [Solirubrobacterales bacterium]